MNKKLHRDNAEGLMNIFVLILLGTIWGASYLFIKITVAEVPSLTLVAGRVTMAAVVLWIALQAGRHRLPRVGKAWVAYTVLGLSNMALPFFLVAWAEQYIPSGLAALLQATIPIFTVVMAHFLTSDERFNFARVTGVAFGFMGVGLVMIPALKGGLAQASLWGQLAVIVSSALMGVSAILARKFLQGQRPIVSSTGVLTMAAVIMLPASLLIDRPFNISPSPEALVAWLTLSVLGTSLALILHYWLIARTGATFATMVNYVVPVNGLILGALVLKESLNPMVLLSLALIFCGIFLVNRRQPDRTVLSPSPAIKFEP